MQSRFVPSVYLPDLVGKPALSRSSGLGTISAQMLDRNRMTPGNLLNRNAQSCRQTLPLDRAGCVVAARNGFHEFSIQTGGGNELINGGSRFF